MSAYLLILHPGWAQGGGVQAFNQHLDLKGHISAFSNTVAQLGVSSTASPRDSPCLEELLLFKIGGNVLFELCPLKKAIPNSLKVISRNFAPSMLRC